MESQDLDKLFQHAFEHAEETPDERVWKGIQKELATEKHIIPFYKKYNHLLAIAATCLLFFGIGLAYFNYQNPHKQNNTISSNVAMIPAEKEEQNEAKYFEIESNSPTETSTSGLSEVPSNNLHHNSYTLASIENSTKSSEDKVEIKNENIESQTLETEELLVNVDIEITPADFNYADIQTIEFIPEDNLIEYTTVTTKEQVKPTLVTKILNKITKNIDLQENREIQFKNDEEGSLFINILNAYTKK